ncbi:MAG: hypothetical protein EBS87_11805 [Sphingomonadaceae bacterium]|nr:hypothetical protein [Sphingomonadaceae bacterium]NCA02822.1 hypothetical protein [Sphingomonadaceae bacterium]
MLKKIAKWAGKRAKERSTYAGVAIVATVLGADKLGMQIDQIGQAVGLIVGGGLIGSQTRD